MNFILPKCDIPDEIGRVFKGDLFSGRKSYAQIKQEIYSSPFLRFIVPKLFSVYIKKGNFESIFNAIGWNGFRDRLAALYIYKIQTGEFPTAVDVSFVQEIKNFEEEFLESIPEGDSRIFMLGFYLKLAESKLRNDHQFLEQSFLRVKPVVKKIMGLGQQKTLSADWLILTLICLSHLYTEERLLEIFQENKGNFLPIYNQLNDDEQKFLISNLLAYGASINEEDFFLDNKV